MTRYKEKDTLYANPLGSIGAFSFDAKTAAVFPDMIQRSAPGYAAIIQAIGLLAARFCREQSRCYDLGCSLGAASFAMQREIRAKEYRIVAVDNSAAMLDRMRLHLNENQLHSIDMVCADIRAIPIEQASVVVLNFTLQFVPIADRPPLIAKIYQGLLPGGALILSEKIAFVDPRQQQLHTELHHAFKQAQGYSELEISQKRTALENVLLPETLETHQNRLRDAGFASAETWFQYFNFASLIALK